MVIAEHSVDLSLLDRDSKVLDLGCRAFSFTNEILNYVDKVYCVEPDPSVTTTDERITLIHVAVGKENKLTRYVSFGNGTGNYIETNEPRPAECKVDYVPMWTLEKILRYFAVDEFDLIKMDVEGSEYDVLMSLVRPPAKQITFELHQHTPKKRTQEEIDRLFEKLSLWYEFKVIDKSEKHGCGENYWDVLIVRK